MGANIHRCLFSQGAPISTLNGASPPSMHEHPSPVRVAYRNVADVGDGCGLKYLIQSDDANASLHMFKRWLLSTRPCVRNTALLKSK